jgi:hypothetical protein
LRRGRQGVRSLPLRAMYSLGELARAASMDPRTLRRLLADGGVEFDLIGRVTFVRITELHEKAFSFWEAIQTVQTLASGQDDLLEDLDSTTHSRHREHP